MIGVLCETPRWFGHADSNMTLEELRAASIFRRYILSLYWSTLTLTTIGNTSGPFTDLEYLVHVHCKL